MSRGRGRSRRPALGATISGSSYGLHEPEQVLAERVTALEVSQEMTTARFDERMGAIAAQLVDGQQRFTHGRERMDELHDRLRDTERLLEPLQSVPAQLERLSRDLSPLPSRMTKLEAKVDSLGSNFVKYRNGGLYFIGMLMLSLVLSGRMTIDQFWKIVLGLGKALM